MARVIADKYDVKGVLGEGGTGIVYDAVRISDSAPVALKVMHEALAGDQQIRGRFQREATILRRLDGDHVCKVLDFGEVPGEAPDTTLLYIAMPKIDGEALSSIVQRAPLPVDRALDVMLEVLAALAAAHGQGVIHRDLKPANVLIDKDGKVIVGDFGMSKIVTGTGTGTTNLTAHNMLFGTPEYMSPEQARGDELDVRCDVYAAGVMLYELLAGEPPFTGTTPLAVLTSHLTGELVRPSTKPGAKDRISPALEAVVLHALARDPAQRYPSAVALAGAIKHARRAPDDTEAVRPALSSAPTLPGNSRLPPAAPSSAARSNRPPASGTDVDPNAPTLLGNSEIPRSAVPSRPPAQARLPSKPPAEPASSRTSWIAVWIVVIVASIAAGALLALRH